MPKVSLTSRCLHLCAAALTLVLSWTAPARAQAPEPPGPDKIVSYTPGLPNDSASAKKPLVFVFTDPPKPGDTKGERKLVTITDLPVRKAGETVAQATLRKRTTIIDAINEQLGKDRAKVSKDGKKIEVGGLFQEKGKPKPWQMLKDGTKQAGDSGSIRQGSGRLSFSGSIGNPDLIDQVASGFGPDGEASLLEFGIAGMYVASLLPRAGDSDLSLLHRLGADLSAHGMATTFDATTRTLTLDRSAFSEDTPIYWSNTDLGLDFAVSLFTTAVPEPGTWLLLIAGLGVLAARSRRPSRAAS